MAKKGTREKSIKRLQRLAKATAADEYPTSKGNVKFAEKPFKRGGVKPIATEMTSKRLMLEKPKLTKKYTKKKPMKYALPKPKVKK